MKIKNKREIIIVGVGMDYEDFKDMRIHSSISELTRKIDIFNPILFRIIHEDEIYINKEKPTIKQINNLITHGIFLS